MQLGLIGLGKMGGNMAERLRLGGHQVVGFDFNQTPSPNSPVPATSASIPSKTSSRISTAAEPSGSWCPRASPSTTPSPISSPCSTPATSSSTAATPTTRTPSAAHKEVAAKGFQFVDVGTSGGVWGLKEGYSMMIGGDNEAVEYLRPIFETLAPATDKGWGHVGPAGAGHFVKMVHNGIEYGMMQAYAEGFTIMEQKEEFNLDLPQIAQIWRYGSVVRSWLLDLTADALAKNPHLDGLEAYVVDSGEGRWTVMEAIDLNVSAPVITESVIRRIRSREENNFTDRMLAIMRNEFGGHAVKKRLSTVRQIVLHVGPLSTDSEP